MDDAEKAQNTCTERVPRYKLEEIVSILSERAAEHRAKAASANIFDGERVKRLFAAKEIEKLIEEIKRL